MNKKMTPEEYLDEKRKEVLQIVAGKAYPMLRYPAIKGIDATGRTDGLLIGPDVPWSRKRVLEWGEWECGDVVKKGQEAAEKGLLTEYAYPEEIGCAVAIRIGRYIDPPESDPVKFDGQRKCDHCGERMPVADIHQHEQFCPENPMNIEYAKKGSEKELADAVKEAQKPELSRFLPEGWKWEVDKNGERCVSHTGPVSGKVSLYFYNSKDTWHSLGLLHPSEGGGFQHSDFGEENPCHNCSVDFMLDPTQVIYTNDADKMPWDKYSIHWRPHFQQEDRENKKRGLMKLSEFDPDGTHVHKAWFKRTHPEWTDEGKAHKVGEPMPCDRTSRIQQFREGYWHCTVIAGEKNWHTTHRWRYADRPPLGGGE